MIFKPSSDIWERIHCIPIPSISGCWEKCGGGFCCNNRHELVRFRAIPSGRQSFPVLESEYLYLDENKFMAPEMRSNAREMSTVLKKGLTASVQMVTCSQGGSCFSWGKRPLICKLYPFIPIPDLDGKIIRFEVGSVFDIMFHLAGLPSPCAVLEEKSSSFQSELKDAIGFIFEMPYFIFYFRAFEVLANHLRTGFSEHYSGSPSLDYQTFFRDFELLYMSRKIFSNDLIRHDLSNLYSSLESKYGVFEI